MTNDKVFDWKKMEEEVGGNFSPFAEVGTHKAKVESVDLRESKNAQGETTYWMDFLFMDEGVKFPKISRAISFKNNNWRRVHFMCILKELGIAEDKAKKAIETAEAKSGTDNIVSAYVAVFDRAVAKHPEIEIDISEDDKLNPKTGRPYMRADFKNPAISFGRSEKKTTSTSEEIILDQAEEISGDALDIPF